ncbi:hypothetical protein ACH47Z_42480 [Streptomyces sp. NPDC020192]
MPAQARAGTTDVLRDDNGGPGNLLVRGRVGKVIAFGGIAD